MIRILKKPRAFSFRLAAICGFLWLSIAFPLEAQTAPQQGVGGNLSTVNNSQGAAKPSEPQSPEPPLERQKQLEERINQLEFELNRLKGALPLVPIVPPPSTSQPKIMPFSRTPLGSRASAPASAAPAPAGTQA